MFGQPRHRRNNIYRRQSEIGRGNCNIELMTHRIVAVMRRLDNEQGHHEIMAIG